ncbi:MAG TPA: hypothetical protein VK988_10910 [Acidimicrobiales bacterium]|nr:hypothetical protein [Acidimicrobiales bacterium]
MVTHRLASASRFDRIAVLQGGRVVEAAGSNGELLDQGGDYAGLLALQQIGRP